jgi:hypothetical protein
VTDGVRLALEPPRLLWLAGLGGTALTLRSARDAWAHLVNEGVAVEFWLRRRFGLGQNSAQS